MRGQFCAEQLLPYTLHLLTQQWCQLQAFFEQFSTLSVALYSAAIAFTLYRYGLSSMSRQSSLHTGGAPVFAGLQQCASRRIVLAW